MANTKPARGMRDFLPSDVRKRNYVIGIIKEVYESYGFEPLETPSVENLETLTGKYGEEGNQLIFKILKRGEKLQEELNEGKIKSENELSDLALRYDLTVPLARVVANHKNDLPKFFKRYQIQPVWRADRPAKGRFREFYQCDVDAIGSNSMTVEVEQISAVSEILMRLGFNDFVIRINHRNILRGILEVAGVPAEKHTDALIALDKIDKIGREGVEKEFRARGITNETGVKLLTFFEFFIKEKSNKFFNEEQKLILAELQKNITAQEENLKIVGSVMNQISQDKSADIDNQSSEFAGKWLDQSSKELDELISVFLKLREQNSNSNLLETKSSILEENIINQAESKNVYETFLNLQKKVPLIEVLKFTKQNLYGMSGTVDLYHLLNYAKTNDSYSHIQIDPSLARGLSYYTGTIFEINVPDLAGSLGGGGRYDGLIGMFSKEQIPACGFSLGLERILVVMEERGMFEKPIAEGKLKLDSADVMVTIWNEESTGKSLKLANEIREKSKELDENKKGLRVLVYPEADKLGKQFKYADSIKIPFVCVLGESELAENKVTLKNLQTGEQEIVSRGEIAAKIVSGKS